MDLVDVLIAEHRSVEGLLADIETTSDRAIRRETLFAAIAELRRHSAREERFLYPTTREHLAAGEDLAAHELREHAHTDEMMDRIAVLDDTDPAYEPLITELFTEVR